MEINKIYKYKLDLVSTQYLSLPEDYQILSVQIQNEHLTLWAIVDIDKPKVSSSCQIFIVGTGFVLPAKKELLEYIATVQHKGFVWHIFTMK